MFAASSQIAVVVVVVEAAVAGVARESLRTAVAAVVVDPSVAVL